MSRAGRCDICDIVPAWTVERQGDVVVSWACDAHLAGVCLELQRIWETTRLTVTIYIQRGTS